MTVQFKHYKYTMHDMSNNNPDALLFGGKDYSVIKTWGYVDMPGGVEGIELYAKYYAGHVGAHTYEDITMEHDEFFREQLAKQKVNVDTNETVLTL